MNKNTIWNPLLWLFHDFLIGIMTAMTVLDIVLGQKKLFSLNQQFIFRKSNDPGTSSDSKNSPVIWRKKKTELPKRSEKTNFLHMTDDRVL